MKFTHAKIIKSVIILLSSIVVVAIVPIALISPIAKHLIEKYDVKYTGRQITAGWVYVNPFTGYVHIGNLKIYEYNAGRDIKEGDSIFFSAKGASANFALKKLLSRTIEITELTVDRPKGIIIQQGKHLNFNDLITKFTPKKNRQTSRPYHFNLLKINIINGEFHYFESVIPVVYYIKDVNIVSTGILWNADTIAAGFSLLSGTGAGTMKGNFTINFKTSDYWLNAIVHKFDLTPIEQYLKDLINYGHFIAFLEADIKASGNLKDPENLNAFGMLELNDFHFGKNPLDDYASFKKLVLRIEELSPRNHQYLFDSVLLSQPYFKYERYDELDNLQTMFGKNGSNISATKANTARFNLILQIAEYIKALARNFFRSDYMINRLAVYKGRFLFNDYSLSEKFSIEANPVTIIADSVNKNHKRVKAILKSGVQPYGDIQVNLSINPKDSSDFDFHYNLRQVPAALFNPYLITYTSFPLDRGTLEFNGTWNVRNGIIKSENHLLVIDPRITKRLRKKDTKWIPLPLIMSLIRERGNIIDYEIPITGDLKNPKFHLKDVILDLLGNIFIKPATTPYRLQVKTVENVIEKSLTLKWNMRQSNIMPAQERFLDKMADFLKENPKASITVYPMLYAEKEKEYIRFFEARKKYYLFSQNKKGSGLSEEDSLLVERMSVKDSMFIRYLNKYTKGQLLFTVQDKCEVVLGPALVLRDLERLNKARRKVFLSGFNDRKVDKQVKINAGENTIPYNGFSFYKIVYQGELPHSLVKAYKQMNDLNNRAPRKWFKKEREKMKRIIQ